MNVQKRVGKKWTEEKAVQTLVDVRGVKLIRPAIVGDKPILHIPEGSLGLRRLGAKDYLQRVCRYDIVIERRRR